MQDEEVTRHDEDEVVDQEETQETPTDNSSDTAAEPEQDVETEDNTDDGGDPESDKKGKDKPWFRHRIERERAKVEKLQKRLDELEKGQKQPTETEPKPEHFLTNAEYQRALARHEAEEVYGKQREAQHRHYQQQMQQQQQMQAWQSKIQDYVSRTGNQDYATTVSNAEVDLDDSKVEGLMDSEYGPDIAYDLASNPDKAWRVSQMTPKQFDRFLAKEEVKIEMRPATQEEQPPTAGVSKAPAPASKSKGNKTSSNTLDDYVARRRAEIYRS